MKVLTVVGARPQFVKAAAVSREFASHKEIKEILVHTGQHFDSNMSDIFFEEMQIPRPDYFLGVHSVSHGAMTGRMLEKIEEVLLSERPDQVLVYGDTNSTLAGALAAKKLHIKVAHVEAGLRSFNMGMPEEINRTLTDRISDILFCPTDNAVDNLNREGFHSFPCTIVKCGDVMLDAAKFYRDIASQKSEIVGTLGLEGRPFALCTLHRAENTDDSRRLRSIMEGISALGEELAIVLPIHPRTKKMLETEGITLSSAVKVIEPVGYLDMIQLLEHAKVVLTDSGGLQKEAFFFEKPCVTLRDETEWIELIEAGFNVLAGPDSASIVKAATEMLTKSCLFDKDLYGRGNASREIVNAIIGSAK